MLLHGSRRNPKKNITDAINLMTRANVGVGATQRAGDTATLINVDKW